MYINSLQLRVALGMLYICAFIFFIPIVTQAQAVPPGYNPCWLKADCEKAGGVWGKNSSPGAGGGVGTEMDAGESDKRNCQQINGETSALCWNAPPVVTLAIPIPGVTDRFCTGPTLTTNPRSCSTDSECGQGNTCRPGIQGGFPNYLAQFYKFFVAMLAVLAVVMVMWGGFKRIMAAGSSEKISDANDTIMSAISGLVLALLSYSLLVLVNPKLVSLTGMRLEKLKTELFGDWCAVDLKRSSGANNYVMCGDEYKDPATQFICRGQRCDNVLWGCYPNGCYPKGCKDDSCWQGRNKCDSGDSVHYKCQTKSDGCSLVNDDNVERLFGSEASEDHNVFETACNTYSDNAGLCTWVEYSGMTNEDDRCHYYSQAFRQTFCVGKTSCDDFNLRTWQSLGLIKTATGTEYAACHRDADWCNLGCRVTWFTPLRFAVSYWNCVRK